MSELSSAPVKRLLVEGAGGMRVSAPALEQAVMASEEYVRRLGAAAAEHAGRDRRKTLKDSDIVKARAELAPPPPEEPSPF